MTLPYIGEVGTYIYSRSVDFPQGLKPACLHQEIEDSAIASPLVGVFLENGNDDCLIHFSTDLSVGDEIILDTVVSNHDPGCELADDTGGGIQGVYGNPNDGDFIVWDATAGVWITHPSELGLDSPTDFWASLDFDRVQSDGISSTTSTTFQNKTSLSFTNSSDAEMIVRVGYTAEFNAANNNKATEVELYETVLAEQHANSVQQTNAGTNWFVFSGFHLEAIPAGATRTFQINFRVSPGLTTTCSIRNAEIEIWRIT